MALKRHNAKINVSFNSSNLIYLPHIQHLSPKYLAELRGAKVTTRKRLYGESERLGLIQHMSETVHADD